MSAGGAEKRKMKGEGSGGGGGGGGVVVAGVGDGTGGGRGVRDGHALLSIQRRVFRGINVKACLGTTFSLQPLPPSPSLPYLPCLQLFFPPRGRPHLLFSGEVKNSKLAGRKPREEGRRAPENGQNEGMS